MNTYNLIDNETGELLKHNEKIYTLQDEIRIKKFTDKTNEYEQFKSIQSEILGSFVFFIYKHVDDLSKTLNDSELTKFIYLGTYVKHDGILQSDNYKQYITKSNLHKILNITYEAANKLYNKLIDNNLMIESDGILYILNYFHYGKRKRYQEITGQKLEEYIRIYIKTTRSLYESTSVRNHGKLAIAYKLLPYVHWKYNILCRNPNEKCKDKLDVLNFNDILEISGYSKENKYKFKKYFYSITCNGHNMFASIEQGTKENIQGYDITKIYVNPTVYYRGETVGDLQHLFGIFDIGIRI